MAEGFDFAIAPRIHVLLAKEARYGVVIRRGPSKRVCTIGWNREDDTFSVGQWLKGRIYERRCDLSPDGRHLIYFAMNGLWDSEVKGSWTAISRAPYLKALGLWPKGDCWHGGGLFLDKKTYWLNDGHGHSCREVPPELTRAEEYPNYEYFGGECPGVYYLRLMRDGWLHQGYSASDNHGGVTTFEKRINDHWILRKFAHSTSERQPGKGCYFDTHEIENSRTGGKTEKPTWEWADLDHGRLVWSEDGKLFAGRLSTQGFGPVKELYDFNALPRWRGSNRAQFRRPAISNNRRCTASP